MTGEPSQVLLRMYGQLLDKNDTKITDSVITMLLSERNLGPKLYGIFPGGRLEEYIPVSIFLLLTFFANLHILFCAVIINVCNFRIAQCKGSRENEVNFTRKCCVFDG